MSDYPASHHCAHATLLPPYPVLQGDHRFDVCIVGAGYTGVSAALQLAEHGYSVAVVEAHRVGWGASGRNGGQLGYAMTPLQPELIGSQGEDKARALWDVAVDAVDLFHQLCARHAIQCDFVSGNIGCATTQQDADYLAEHADKVASYGNHCYQYLDQSEACQVSGSPLYKGAIRSQKSGHINPLKYLLGLTKAAQAAGVSFFEQSPVNSIQDVASIIVKCDQGQITADHAIVACNGYLAALLHDMGKRILPMDNYQVATAPLDDALLSTLIRDGSCVWDTTHSVHYFRLTPDRRLTMGCGIGIPGRPPKNIEQDSRRHLEFVYPQLKGVALDHVWGGTLAGTLNQLPDVGQLQTNIYYAQGFTGHGVALAPFVGREIANAIHSQSAAYDLLSTTEHRNIPGGRLLRRPLVIGYRFLSNTRDMWSNKFGRT